MLLSRCADFIRNTTVTSYVQVLTTLAYIEDILYHVQCDFMQFLEFHQLHSHIRHDICAQYQNFVFLNRPFSGFYNENFLQTKHSIFRFLPQKFSSNQTYFRSRSTVEKRQEDGILDNTKQNEQVSKGSLSPLWLPLDPCSKLE